MDNNNNQAPTPVVPPVATAPATTNPAASAPEAGNKNMIIMLVVGVIIILTVVGGIYYFLSLQQATPEPQANQTTNVPPRQPSLADVKDALEQELDSINVSASEGDFKSVDQDLQNL